MADQHAVDSRVSAEGRVVIPAEIRRILGIGPGDRVRFVMEEGQVHLVTPRLLAMSLWADNHGGDAGDSAADVRAARDEDRRVDERAQDRIDADVAADADPRSDDELAGDLLAAVGLRR
ncbi:MAG: AbrB/MazE/SpoVT family DNA-binding domain-containing protein [Actinomycetes bacterium]